MTIHEVRRKACGLGLALPAKTTKVEMIRTIQRIEGNNDCFGRGMAETCGQDICCFREDCLKKI